MSDIALKKIMDDIGVERDFYYGFKFRCGDDFEEPNPLDTIPSELPGCINMNRLLEICDELEKDRNHDIDMPMVRIIRELFQNVDTRTRSSWAGIPLSHSARMEKYRASNETLPLPSRVVTTDRRYNASLAYLASDNREHQLDPHNAPDSSWVIMQLSPESEECAFYGRFFQVVKQSSIVRDEVTLEVKSALDRAIYSAVHQNKWSDKPPSFSLASVQQIRKAFLAFDRCYCSTGDWRHFFFQFILPKLARSLFGIHSAGPEIDFAQCVLPMGFGWAPAGAEATAMLAWWKAIRQAGFIPVRDPDCKGDVPGVWQVFAEGGSEPIAYVFAWIDNSLVVAGDPSVRDKLQASITSVCAHLNMIWKGSGMEPNDSDPEFIGINFLIDQSPAASDPTAKRSIPWRHTQQNIDKWKATRAKSAVISSARHAAQRIGVVLWDSQFRYSNHVQIAHLFLSLSGVAKRVRAATQVDDEDDWGISHGCTQAEIEAIERAYSGVLDNRNGVFETRPLMKRFVGVCTDMSSTYGAGAAVFDDSGAPLPLRPYNDRAKGFSWRREMSAKVVLEGINWGEAWVAITALIPLVRRAKPLTEFRLAIDNTVAEAWLKRGASRHAILNDMLRQLHALLQQRQCSLTVLGIATELCFADIFSRDNGDQIPVQTQRAVYGAH